MNDHTPLAMPTIGTRRRTSAAIEDAAAATVAALSADGPAIFNIVDEEPASAAEWLPAFAAAIGAPRPMRVPARLARPIAGSYGIQTMVRVQGASSRACRAAARLAATPS